MKATLNDFAGVTGYTPNDFTHMTLVWVTKADGTFIKTLWKQGPVDFADTKYADHFTTWNTARGGQFAGSTVLDGYTGPTATTYSTIDSPLDITWNCRDATHKIVPDGDYNIHIQYTERMDGEAPVSVNGLKWTKGPGAFSSTYANTGTKGDPEGGFNLTAMSVNWAQTAASTPYQTWATAAGLTAGQDGPTQTPKGDGVTNLEKFAFNMDGSKPVHRTLIVGNGDTVGLPGGTTAAGKLRIEFLRRKAGTNPGVTYTPQFGSDLAGWTNFTGTPVAVTSIDSTWERVVVDDPATGTIRFGRVKLIQTP